MPKLHSFLKGRGITSPPGRPDRCIRRLIALDAADHARGLYPKATGGVPVPLKTVLECTETAAALEEVCGKGAAPREYLDGCLVCGRVHPYTYRSRRK